jgi:hypothetical protein
MTFRKFLTGSLKPLVAVAAAIYFVIDALVLAILKPLLKRLTDLKLFEFVALWITSLGPYPSLAIFLIPLILLEPIKPVAAYAIASGHFVSGVLILVIGELLKIMIVERIFHVGRPKLMTIRAFAFAHDFVVGWVTWVQALPPWPAIKRGFADIGLWMRKIKRSRTLPRAHLHIDAL